MRRRAALPESWLRVLSIAAALPHSGNRHEQKKLILSTAPLLFKSANDDDSTVPHNPINRGNRWWCCFQRWHTKRNEGTIVVLLVFSTIADWTVSYWTGDGRRV